MARTPVLAAGGIVLRQARPPLFAVVRLRKRNEWVLPKGKLDDGETPRDAAEREVNEETGHDVIMREFLGTLVYDSGGRSKVVHYWRMQADGDQVYDLMTDIREVDWLPLDKAVDRLSRSYERVFLENVGPIALAAAAAEQKARVLAEKALAEKVQAEKALAEQAAAEKAAAEKAALAAKAALAKKRRARPAAPAQPAEPVLVEPVLEPEELAAPTDVPAERLPVTAETPVAVADDTVDDVPAFEASELSPRDVEAEPSLSDVEAEQQSSPDEIEPVQADDVGELTNLDEPVAAADVSASESEVVVAAEAVDQASVETTPMTDPTTADAPSMQTGRRKTLAELLRNWLHRAA